MNGSRTTKRLRAINASLRPFLRGKNDPERAWAKAVTRAQQMAGVAIDAEDRQWIEEFGFLISCVARFPGLAPVGWVTSIMDAQARLVNRLRIRDLHRCYPAIGNEPIESPIFVVGLPRTATTLAHNILAAAPGCRGPLLWEMTHTDLELPPEETARLVTRARRQFRTTQFALDFAHIHPIDATRPEESMFLIPHGVYHILFHAPMPDYREWFGARDTTADYVYIRRALQVLQHGRERRRWVLKYPFDLGQMHVIKKVFPGATFVWTHRDPATVIGSTCSLADLCQALFVTRPDRAAIGSLVLDVLSETVEKGRAFRQQNLADVVDVPYHQMTADAILSVPKLFKRLGLEFTQADGERLGTALQKPQRDRAHEYALGNYGLTPEAAEARFASYQAWANSFNYGRLSGPPDSSSV
jgi:hypothetical protein